MAEERNASAKWPFHQSGADNGSLPVGRKEKPHCEMPETPHKLENRCRRPVKPKRLEAVSAAPIYTISRMDFYRLFIDG
jgi:hypothetical protein